MGLKGWMMTKRKRTKKQFLDYNDYHDRPFGLKWGTAFALDELMKVVNQNKKTALLDIKELPLMSRVSIDKVLQIAVIKSLRVSIQLNHRDEVGNLSHNIEGVFQGYSDEDFLYIDDLAIEWQSIRNVAIIEK